jgi:hypothetical protein
MSYAKDPLSDPRREASEAHALAAEQAWSRGERSEAYRQFELAAQLEEEVAREVGAASPRLRSLLAISAVALWYKAGRYDASKRLAYHFLAASELLTEQGCSELEELVDRCSRESELSKSRTIPG